MLDVAPENVRVKERLHPGRIFMVDTRQGRIIDDAELKDEFANEHPYDEWLKSNMVAIENLPSAEANAWVPTRIPCYCGNRPSVIPMKISDS